MKSGRKKLLLVLIMAFALCITWISGANGEECGIGTAARRTVETTEEIIPYETEYRTDTSLAPGSKDKVIQEGENGSRVSTYLVDYENGAETGRKLKDVSVTEPTRQIIGVAPRAEDIVTKEETTQETVYYETETVNDPDRIKGEEDKIIQEGKNGTREVVYTVQYVNGVEISRIEKSSRIITPAVNRIVSVATGKYNVTYYTETVAIPFETEYQDAPNWRVGEESVAQEGQDGEKEVTYAIYKDKNGNEVSRKVYAEKVTRSVTNKIIYKGTFVPEVTYTVVAVPDLPECDGSLREDSLDKNCIEWAMHMAENDTVEHAPMSVFHCESVGGWRSIDEVLYGRDYSVHSNYSDQTYHFEDVSLGSHGGQGLSNGYKWGAGCVKRSETQPDGSIVDVYYACARSNNY